MTDKPAKPAHRHERTDARRLALQILYQSDILNDSPSAIASEGRYILEEGVASDYVKRLVEGVEEHRDEIDDQLRTFSENWSLGRMPVVDRSLLRMAIFEMLYVDEVPISVSINEAVELAKDFGGEDDSSRFVNGILGRVARDIEPELCEEGADGEQPASVSELVDAVAERFAAEQAAADESGQSAECDPEDGK